MWTENRCHGIEFFGESAAFTFYCDTDWGVREYFENWMGEMVNTQTKEPRYYETFTGEVDVIALDKQDNRVKRWTLYEAFPRLLNITPVAQGGDGVVRVTVTFSIGIGRKPEVRVDLQDLSETFDLVDQLKMQ